MYAATKRTPGLYELKGNLNLSCTSITFLGSFSIRCQEVF